jgi:ankyrin repeat protein
MTAARTGKLGSVEVLLTRGAVVDTRLEKGQTALMWAAADGHTAVVKALLAAGADFRTPLETGFTPLLFAARAGHADVVRVLLDAGIDVNAVTSPTIRPDSKQLRKGSSVLTTAVENGRFELAALLVDRGADASDMRSGYSPLHILSWIRKPDRGEDEGDPIPEDPGQMTSEQLIRILIAKGADVNARLTGGPSGGGRINRKGCTPFMLAADTADTSYMRLLVERREHRDLEPEEQARLDASTRRRGPPFREFQALVRDGSSHQGRDDRQRRRPDASDGPDTGQRIRTVGLLVLRGLETGWDERRNDAD